MVDAGLAGDVTAARPIAEALLPVTLALFAEPSPAVIKAVLHAQGNGARADAARGRFGAGTRPGANRT